ncbi:MAG: hypothetical protein ACI4OT_02460 [Bacilli bacterium]
MKNSKYFHSNDNKSKRANIGKTLLCIYVSASIASFIYMPYTIVKEENPYNDKITFSCENFLKEAKSLSFVEDEQYIKAVKKVETTRSF